MFSNVEARYVGPKGKPIHTPSDKGQYVGLQVRELLAGYQWDAHYQHLGGGGHVGVLHRHRSQTCFATADISNFFGSVRRNMVAAALRKAGVHEHRHFAKWSTVKAPGGYVLPFGFPSSVQLATLVMQESTLGAFLRVAARAVTVQVFLDDISMSHDDPELLEAVYDGLLSAVRESGLEISERKSTRPALRVELFNCSLEHGRSEVLPERRAKFYAEPRSEGAVEGFERYCRAVKAGNWLDGAATTAVFGVAASGVG